MTRILFLGDIFGRPGRLMVRDFLPGLVGRENIDLVVANILLALGMMMMSPTTVSLPFKLLLFVLVDGWAKLVHGLVLTYAG